MNQTCFCFILITCICIWLLFPHIKTVQEIGTTFILAESTESPKIANSCFVQDWNRKTTDDIAHSEQFKKWSNSTFGFNNNLIDGQSRLLSAFVYPEDIAIVTTVMHTFRQNATCHYYDCNKAEIPFSKFQSLVWPTAVISCPRRFGAEYVSVSFNETVPPEPIPLTFRAYDKPVHELSVCVGPLYGNESKWLQIIEYVEHYQLLGTSFFYFTLFNMNEYDRKIIDNYERLGIAESTKYVTEYLRLGWMSHFIQTHECHHRSKFHSKWVVNMDIDERLVYTGPNNFIHYLRSLPPNIGEISFSTRRVLKTERSPEKFTNEEQLLSDLSFMKYNQTTRYRWVELKGMIRPELVAFLFYHWAYYRLEGVHVLSVPKRLAYVRHYRTVDPFGLGAGWTRDLQPSLRESRLPSSFEKELITAVKKRVKYVYDQRIIRCEEIPEWVWKRFKSHLFDCKFKNESSIEIKKIKF